MGRWQAHATTVVAASLLTAVAGEPFSITVTPHDTYGNAVLSIEGVAAPVLAATIMVDGAADGVLGWGSHTPLNMSLSATGATLFTWQVSPSLLRRLSTGRNSEACAPRRQPAVTQQPSAAPEPLH